MQKIEKRLREESFSVLNIDSPSRHHPIEELSKFVRKKVLSRFDGSDPIHAVTHSMGGSILRYIQKNDPIPNLCRVVMLAPPNQGSEVVDELGKFRLFHCINGPAGRQLGTADDGFVKALGTVDFDLGVLTGDRTINLLLSLLIPGPNDGKVSTRGAQVEGMRDFRIIPSPHPFIMKNKYAIAETVRFLNTGRFSSKDADKN